MTELVQKKYNFIFKKVRPNSLQNLKLKHDQNTVLKNMTKLVHKNYEFLFKSEAKFVTKLGIKT